jgi:hypothetical protein
MGGLCAVRVKVCCYLPEAPSGTTLAEDPSDQLGRYSWGPTERRRLRASSSWSSSFGKEALQLVDRDKTCAPRHLDRLD